MGSFEQLAGMMPGQLGKQMANAELDPKMMAHTEAIILSMTPYERENPAVLGASRKKRIAAGCGLEVVDVNRLLKQFEMMQSMIKQVTRGGKMPKGMGGFGGGVGGSHEELCGAVSGGVLVLSLLHPHTDGEDRAGKVRLYAQAKEFRRRFQEVFDLTRCGDLLRARPGVTERNPASQRLGVTAHCDNMIVTAVEILEQMLQEEPA